MQGNAKGQKLDDSSMMSFGDFSSLLTSAHELKAPLALIRQLSLSLNQSNTTTSSEREKMIEQITLTSERALRLVTSLTRSSRLDDTIFDIEPLHSLRIMEDVAHELQPLYNAKNRQLYVSSKCGSQLIVANRELLHQILLNFGDNALHYSDSNKAVELCATASRRMNSVRLGVRDFGPTMTKKTWQCVRKGMGHQPQPVHARPQSSGLGLYLNQQFATAMDAQLGMVRHRNGATFFVETQASTQLTLL